jgi:hypothetical protein
MGVLVRTTWGEPKLTSMDERYDEGGEQDLEYDGARDGRSDREGEVNAMRARSGRVRPL